MEPVLFNYVFFWVIIVGLCLGSFYNVVIIRSLSGESLVFPASKCPKCGNKLKPWHNIPVVSYIFLGGKCAFCKNRISIQYPLVEIVTAILFALSFYKYGISWDFLYSVIVCSALIILASTDIKEKLVDCHIAIGLGAVGLLYNFFFNSDFFNALYGLLAGILFMEIIARLGYLFGKNRAFGEGDTYIIGAVGACFGIAALPKILIYTLVASMIYILPVFIYKQFKLGNKSIPILFVLFILFALGVKQYPFNLILISLLLITSIILMVTLIRQIKIEVNPLYLPLVPAITIGSLYFLLF